MLTSIYIYNAFVKFGPWSEKHQRSEDPGNSTAGPQQQVGFNDGAAAGSQCHPAISLLMVGSENAGFSMVTCGSTFPSVHLGQDCNFISAVFMVWKYLSFCCS